MIKKEQLRAKAQFSRSLNNPGLKSGVIDNELIADFSPKSGFINQTGYSLNII